jgi:outer membrane cobalamin receptor
MNAMTSVNKFRQALLSTTLGAGALAAAFAAGPVKAQSAQPVETQSRPQDDPDAKNEAIVVTGSRIARPNIEQSSPVSVISEEEISLSQRRRVFARIAGRGA